MNYAIKPEVLREFCAKACEKFGYSPEYAAITAEVLTESEMMGTHSHGTKNLVNYIRKGLAGGIRIDADIRILKEGPAWALMDADASIGMVPAYRSMELAIKKAAQCGIAIVNVKNGTHYGASGYYACMAAKRGMVGISISNTEPNMCIPGGRGREIGNSPFSIAFPQKSGDPLYLDIALSAVAALKIEQAKKEGRTIPDTWIVDKDGFPSTSPEAFFDGGAAQPMAAHKGYGLSMAVEILTGVMSGGAILHEMTSWCWDLPTPNKVSYSSVAIDISKFMDLPTFEDRLQEYIDSIHSTPLRKGSARILVPGELETARYKNALESGFLLPSDVAENLLALSELAGLELNLEKRTECDESSGDACI